MTRSTNVILAGFLLASSIHAATPTGGTIGPKSKTAAWQGQF